MKGDPLDLSHQNRLKMTEQVNVLIYTTTTNTATSCALDNAKYV